MQGDLGKTLLLQITDHHVSAEPPVRDPHLHIVEFSIVQCQLEEVLCAIQTLLLDHVLSVDIVHELLVDSDDVDWSLQRMNYSVVSVRQTVLHMTQGRVHKDAMFVPRSALHANVFVERMEVFQVLARHQDVVLRHESHELTVLRPDDVPNTTSDSNVCDVLPQRQVMQYNFFFALQQEPVGSTRVNVICRGCWLDFLRKLILQIEDCDGAAVLENREAVPCGKCHCLRISLFRGDARLALHDVPGTCSAEEVIDTSVLAVENKNICLGGVERVELERLHSRSHRIRSATTSTDDIAFGSLVQINDLHVAILDHVQMIPVSLGQGSFAIQFEDHHASIVTNRNEIRGPMRRDDPEPVIFPPEGVNACALRHIPHANRPVLRVRQNELLLRMEHHTRHIVEVASQGVHLPGFGVVHPPQLDQTVVGS
mmetsp:Transcript_23548/g.61973  ORF Transcript_23548/g.61973 Transcript_23548/m.61973 type:complete len:426 (+) Transcript_23548:1907-3184(+)